MKRPKVSCFCNLLIMLYNFNGYEFIYKTNSYAVCLTHEILLNKKSNN